MSEIAIRPLIDQEMERTCPAEKEELIQRGIYGRVLVVIADQNVQGLSPMLPRLQGRRAAATVRFVDSQHVEEAQEIIKGTIQGIIANGIENFQWDASEML